MAVYHQVSSGVPLQGCSRNLGLNLSLDVFSRPQSRWFWVRGEANNSAQNG